MPEFSVELGVLVVTHLQDSILHPECVSIIVIQFVTGDFDNLQAYSYDGASFTNAGYIDVGGSPKGIAVGPDGSVFLANGFNGLHAYSYNGVSFTSVHRLHTFL